MGFYGFYFFVLKSLVSISAGLCSFAFVIAMMVKNYKSYCMLKVASMFTVKEDHNLVSQEVSEESSEIEGLLDVFINIQKYFV